MIKVTVWNEYRQELKNKDAGRIYPQGIHGCLAELINGEDDMEAATATLDQPEHGLTKEVLDNTDVLIWWGHMHHDLVSDEIVERIKERVLRGMGLIVLHSGHESKLFKSLMGTSCTLKYREGERERVWCVEPNHPIAKGVDPQFLLETEEMYGERFDIPQPDELIFIGWFKGGEVFRSGCTFKRGLGKIFYFQPGHEEYPTYYNENVRKVIKNAVRWACPNFKADSVFCEEVEPLEK